MFKKNHPFTQNFFVLILQMLFLSVVSFALLRAFPGSPFSDLEQWPEFLREKVQSEFQLGGSFWSLWFSWFKNGAGLSAPSVLMPGQSVAEVLRTQLVESAILSSCALAIAIFFAWTLGRLSRLQKTVRVFLRMAATFFLSIPSPVLIPALVFFLSWTSFLEAVVALSLKPMCNLLLVFLDNRLQLSNSGFYRSFSSLGIEVGTMMNKTELRLGLLRFIAILPTLALQLLMGSFLVEFFFNRRGISQVLFSAFTERDLFLLSSLIFYSGSFFLALQLLCSYFSKRLDPRMLADLQTRVEN